MEAWLGGEEWGVHLPRQACSCSLALPWAVWPSLPPAAIETYHLLSQRWFTHASPTLFNAGTPRPQLSSCFLVCMKNDSIEGEGVIPCAA